MNHSGAAQRSVEGWLWLALRLLVVAGAGLPPHLAAAPLSDAAVAPSTYSVVRKISGPDGRWDYASISSERHRLYLAQGGVTTLDLTDEKILPRTVAGRITHAVVYAPETGRLFTTDGADHVVRVFDEASGVLQAEIDTGASASAKGIHNPDALVLDPHSGFLVAVNGDSGDVLLIDTQKRATAGVIHVGGQLEFAVADGAGRLYVNVASSNAIAVVDIRELKVVQRLPLKECEEPTGLAYDASIGLLISVCNNGVAKFIATRSAREVASLKVARGADAVIYDSVRHRVFIPGADDGMVSVISVESLSKIAVVQTIATPKGVRLGAVDETTGRLYLPTADFGPPVPPVPYPSVVPGTFKILVVDTK